MKWLITAFAPFAGAKSNSSLIILEELRKRDLGADFVFHGPVPVEFGNAWENIRKILDNDSSIGGVLALGQAENRSRISLERVALNWNDARIADNAGSIPPQAPIMSGGVEMHWSNVPWEAFPLSAQIERSYSAGTYVCNEVLFRALDWALPQGKRAGFVHLPVLSSQSDMMFEKSPRIADDLAVSEMIRVLEYIKQI